MKWALLSVWDKAGIVDLAKVLVEHDYGLLSSGGTGGAALAEAGIPFTDVSTYTGSPEMMHGRVKTLHPKIHGGASSAAGGDRRRRDAGARDRADRPRGGEPLPPSRR